MIRNTRHGGRGSADPRTIQNLARPAAGLGRPSTTSDYAGRRCPPAPLEEPRSPMLRTVPLILTTAGLLALTACGDAQGPSLSTQSFDSATDLQAAVEERGITCESGRPSEGEGYKESLKCGNNVWLTVFESSEDKRARIETYEQQRSTFVEGPNWVVVAPQQTLDELSG